MSFVYGFIAGVAAALLGVYLFVRFLVDDVGAYQIDQLRPKKNSL
jgi:hypothetical protein